MHPTIKFTAEQSKTSINFLDVTVSLVEGVIETDLHVTPTNSHQYLQSSSRHPFHCKKGIPYSQASRLNRIYSETNSFEINAVMIWKDFFWKEDTVLNWCERKYFRQEKFQEMNC